MDIKIFEPSSYSIEENQLLLVFDKECICFESDNGFIYSNSEVLELHFNLFSEKLLKRYSDFVFLNEREQEFTFTVDELEVITNLTEKIIEFANQKESSKIIEQLEKMNIEHAINLALDMKDKDMFLTLVNGVY